MNEVPTQSKSTPSEVRERFELRVPPAFGPRLLGTVLLSVAFVLVLFAPPLMETGEIAWLFILVGLAATVPSVLALFGGKRRRRTASIEVLEDRVLLPSDGRGRVALPFSALRALFLRKHPVAGFFYVATEDREFVFPTRVFVEGEAERLHELLQHRVRMTSDRLFERLERTRRRAHQAYQRTPLVTWSLVAVLLGLHVYFVSTGLLWNGLDVASFGAVSPELVEATGPYRALTAHWIHGWRFQPLLILPVLLVSGGLVERLMGHGTLAAITLGGAAAGGCITAFFPGAPMHSGAILMVSALVGALLHISIRFQHRLPIGFSLNGQWWSWVVTVAIVAAMVHGLSVPAVVVSLAWGAGLSVLALDAVYELPVVFSPRWSTYIAGGLMALHVGAGLWAIEFDRNRGLELEKIAVEHHDNYRILRDYAAQVAHVKGVSDERLSLALVAADRAVSLAASDFTLTAALMTRSEVLVAMNRLRPAQEIVAKLVFEKPADEGLRKRLAELLLQSNPATSTSTVVATVLDRPSAEQVVLRLPAVPHVDNPVGWAVVSATKDDGPRPAGLLRLNLDGQSSTATITGDALPLQVGDALEVQLIRSGRATSKYWQVTP